MWRSRRSFLEAAGAPGAARRSRPRPPARRGGVGNAIRHNSDGRRAAARWREENKEGQPRRRRVPCGSSLQREQKGMVSKAQATGSPAPLLQGSPEERTKRRQWGLLVTGAVGGALVALYAVVTPFLAPALRKVCLPFVPATSTQIENVLKMLQGRSGSLADIGSGDGRVVIAAAKMGFKAVGYELNPWLVWYSRYRAWRDGVHHNTKFYISNLWKVSFSHYTNVVIFGVPQMMPQLEKKLKEELESNARIIACRFPFPCWIPDHTTGEGIDTVWAYDLKCPRGSERRSLETTPATES
ncbi:ATP synthase subunit C lysine N-methyltransferase [Cygnus atratus]|uniref:ATP synthase subunit C lysine N-methyltransferase n=1 Tax=Cygnus atratus TaxID=8868 RepID=UPI0015D6585A|nr:ATP synthase subunit C lysine N-methyltransferase [Cygnus atratus]